MTRTRPRLLVLAVLGALAALGLLLLACGGGKSGAKAAPDAAQDAEEEGDGGEESGPTGVGAVTFSEFPDAGGTFFAGFSRSLPKLTPGCTVVDAGVCVTTTCVAVAADAAGDAEDDDAGPLGPAPNPGPLVLTGGAFGSGTTIGADKGGTYLYESPGTLFAPGDTLGVSAPGAALPAFTEQSITVSPLIVLTSPGADGGKIPVLTAQPLVVTWTGGQSGATVILNGSATFTSRGAQASMTCAFDAAGGTGTVPSAALKPLAAQNASTSSLTWYQAQGAHFSTGGVAVTMAGYVTQGRLASFQ